MNDLFSSFPKLIRTGSTYALIFSRWYNKIPETRWLLNSRNSCLTVFRSGGPRLGGSSTVELWQKPSSVLNTTNFSLYPYVVAGVREFFGASF